MYVIETRNGHQTLHEMTKRQLAAAQAAAINGNPYHHIVSANHAHRFVYRGGLHTTGLWMDDRGRIRKAK